MRTNPLKAKLKKRELSIGSWITIGNEIVAEAMASQDFDWLVVDMEHSAIELPQAQNLIRVIDLKGKVPLVRVGENNPNIIKRVMDAGAYGVIVPMVNSKDEAMRAVQSVKYPPKGKRGVGLARAQGHGVGFEEYKEWVAKESVVIVQIEHIDAVQNLEDILSVEGVDGFMVGPYDLSGSIGHPGKFNHPKVKSALDHVKYVTKRLKANSGFHVIPPDPKEMNQKIKDGYTVLAFSLDTLILQRSCQSILKQVNRKKK
ncbi:MAG: 2,4-dihydroxyhept-2-ene-1,7-dioic acid aldolase [Candidatus Omnitrophica bacterium]|nr:2,4-dihydroxyhept-2-ene-1,7-dioic acid aldolase [Candidatus Omnitrophota bacterium]